MSARSLAARAFAVVVLVVVLAAGAILLSLSRSDTAGDASRANQDSIVQNRARIVANESKDAATRGCLTADKHPQACLERVTGAVGPGGATGKTGERGRRGLSVTGRRGRTGRQGRTGRRGPGPTAAQVRAAARTYCAAARCGIPPTTGQIATAVADYCASGACRGEDALALPPSEGQVGAAVAAYCASHGNCAGRPGAEGTDGADGQPGAPGTLVLSIETCAVPGMVATDGDGDGTFTCPPITP